MIASAGATGLGHVKAPERIETGRLLLRRPAPDDAAAILARYAGDPDVVRFVSWPRHRTMADSLAFIASSEAAWSRWPAGPYLVLSRSDETLLGGTGLVFETPGHAETGYVFARDAWGRGYATESLRAVIEVAAATGVQRLDAFCHPDHRASWRVLEKCGFARERHSSRRAEFPNLDLPGPHDVLLYTLIL